MGETAAETANRLEFTFAKIAWATDIPLDQAAAEGTAFLERQLAARTAAEGTK